MPRLIKDFSVSLQSMEHEYYMKRCLQLAENGRQNAKPNPMVGAVIVAHDRIIGEGYHIRCGEGHAEVNAFASVRPEDEKLLPEATIYVSLEPCSHYGKTPPCAVLIISKGIKRCVCGCVDLFAKVQGRGIQRMRDAGIEVIVGIMEAECLALNRRFITFNARQRPYILLKWAQTANGFISKKDSPLQLSTPVTQMLVHQLRAENEAVLVGHTTFLTDHPRLDVRQWSGRNPERIVLSPTMAARKERPEGWTVAATIDEVIAHLYAEKKQSLVVEGGRKTLQAFIERGLWDEIRVETAPIMITEGVAAPHFPTHAHIEKTEYIDGNQIITLCR